MMQVHFFFQLRLKSVVAVWHSPKPLAVNKDDGCGADLTNGFIQICFGSFIILGSLSSSRRWLAFKRLYYNAGLFKRIPDRNSRLEQHIEIVSADSCFSWCVEMDRWMDRKFWFLVNILRIYQKLPKRQEMCSIIEWVSDCWYTYHNPKTW